MPMEKDPLIKAAANARLVAPPKFAAVHCLGVSELMLRELLAQRKDTHVVEYGQRRDDGIDEV